MTRFLRLRTKEVYGDAKPTISQSVLSLALAAVNGIVAVFMWFYLRDVAVEGIIYLVQTGVISTWALTFFEIVIAIVLCIVWLIFVFYAQHSYERDFMSSWIPKRFIVYLAAQFIILGACIWFLSQSI